MNSRILPSRNSRSRWFPRELPDDWHDKAIDAMGDLLGKYRLPQVYLIPATSAAPVPIRHYYLGTSDPEEHAGGPVRTCCARSIAATSPLQANIFQLNPVQKTSPKRFSTTVQLFPPVFAAVVARFSARTASIPQRSPMAAREIIRIGGVGKYCNEIIGKVYKIGNNPVCLKQPWQTRLKAWKRM